MITATYLSFRFMWIHDLHWLTWTDKQCLRVPKPPHNHLCFSNKDRHPCGPTPQALDRNRNISYLFLIYKLCCLSSLLSMNFCMQGSWISQFFCHIYLNFITLLPSLTDAKTLIHPITIPWLPETVNKVIFYHYWVLLPLYDMSFAIVPHAPYKLFKIVASLLKCGLNPTRIFTVYVILRRGFRK